MHLKMFNLIEYQNKDSFRVRGIKASNIYGMREVIKIMKIKKAIARKQYLIDSNLLAYKLYNVLKQ